jgi:hypothetical protein
MEDGVAMMNGMHDGESECSMRNSCFKLITILGGYGAREAKKKRKGTQSNTISGLDTY